MLCVCCIRELAARQRGAAAGGAGSSKVVRVSAAASARVNLEIMAARKKMERARDDLEMAENRLHLCERKKLINGLLAGEQPAEGAEVRWGYRHLGWRQGTA